MQKANITSINDKTAFEGEYVKANSKNDQKFLTKDDFFVNPTNTKSKNLIIFLSRENFSL